MEKEQKSQEANNLRKLRRKYEDAFSGDEFDDELEQHIIPEPTLFENEREWVKAKDEVDAASYSKENESGKEITCQAPSCPMKFKTNGDYQAHYNSRHMHACSVCKMSLPSAHILELHVLEIHDTLFSLLVEKQKLPMCFLESCGNKHLSPEDRKRHCVEEHKFEEKFQYWDCKPPRVNLGKSKSKDKASVGDKKKDNLKGHQTTVAVEKEERMSVDHESSALSAAKLKSVPKHIAFGHAPHKVFNKNAYAKAVGSKKDNKVGQVGLDQEGSIDMKDMENALVG